LAACAVTVAHEALGHGSACLIAGGHITVLSSALFRCSVHSVLVDPAGPVMDLAVGTAALIARRFVASPAARLFLLLVMTLSYGWESGYAFHAMLTQDGDLYFAARDLLGAPSLWWRVVGGAAGIGFYLVNVRLTAAGLSRLWPQAAQARRIARVAGLAAVAAAGLAGLAYAGPGWRDLHDAILEIASGAIPLLIIPRGPGRAGESGAILKRSLVVIVMAVGVFALFAAVLGRGLSG
jgi:hypothetical protein